MLLGDIPHKCHLDLVWLKEMAWNKLSTHAEWAKHFGPNGDRQWQWGAPKHVLDYLNLVLDIVYGTHYYDLVLWDMVDVGRDTARCCLSVACHHQVCPAC